jgi:hypothetical protein
MADSQNTHWTTDEHLLVQYVLGQLDASKAADLEEHLRGCPECRNAVAAEQQLAAGVRRAGRDALKQRLAKRIERKGIGTNWYRAAGVAAAIVVLLTIGIYNKWFFPGETRFADSRLKSDSVAPKTESAPYQPAPVQKLPDKMQFADVSKQSAADRDQAESKGAGIRGGALEKKKGDEGLDKRRAENEPLRDRSVANLSKKDQMAAAAEAEGIWVAGTVLSDETNVQTEGKAMDRIPGDVRENAPKGKKEPAAQMSLAARSHSLQAEGQAVAVVQRPLSDLPRNQIRSKPDIALVQTLFRPEADGLSMVLYSDSLHSRSDLGQARLQTIREDSIILQIGNQRIGYRVPPGLTGQMARQLEKAK